MDYLGLVDPEAAGVERLEAGCLPGGAFDVGDGTAAAADHVMMVVAGLRLVECDRSGRLDLAQQAGVGERPQPVVDGLMRYLAEVLAHGLDDQVGIGMRVLVDRGQYGHPGPRHAQVGPAQLVLEFHGCRHEAKDTGFPESIQIGDRAAWTLRFSAGAEATSFAFRTDDRRSIGNVVRPIASAAAMSEEQVKSEDGAESEEAPRDTMFDRKGSGRRFDLTAKQWVIALLIGLSTVFAAGYGWRAAAIGSTAAYNDRQSISETIALQGERIDVSLAVGNDTREYTAYLADYAAAAELDNQAQALARAGDNQSAGQARRQAQFLRRSATQRAADSGVFGESTIADDLAQPTENPRPYSFRNQLRARTVQQQTSPTSPGELNPDRWAEESEGIRDRINGLAVWALVMLLAVLLFTVAEANSARRSLSYGAMGIGALVLVIGAVGGLTVDFF